jgi:predicted nucleotidyltransferase
VSQLVTSDTYGGVEARAALSPIGFSSPVAALLPGVVQRIVQALQPEKVVLFGSYAYGAPSPDSDVDLLIIMETSASRADRYLAVSRLLRPRPFPVDILVKTPSEISKALAEGDFFVREILSRGQVLYERAH